MKKKEDKTEEDAQTMHGQGPAPRKGESGAKTKSGTPQGGKKEEAVEVEEPVKVVAVEAEVKEEAPKDVEEKTGVPKRTVNTESWNPKTGIGKKVKSGEIKSLSEILDKGLKILEVEIVDVLVPDLSMDLLLIGQAKGKFGGGQRRVFRQTQKKTAEGNKPSFATYVVVGNNNGYVGLGYGKARETVPAREKGQRNAKLNIMKIRRGCGSWQCTCSEPHSVPYAVEGKCGSAIIKIMPAPKGTGLSVEKECQKLLAAAGIKDAWSKTKGQTGTKTNLIIACERALEKLVETKVQQKHFKALGIIEGEIIKEEATE